MRLTSTRSSDLFYVDWWLMNHCSWSCSYCHDIIKNGSAPLPNIKDCVWLIDQLHDYAQQRNQRVSIDFTGGEVTEWNDFKHLLIKAKERQCLIRFRSNGSLEATKWDDLMNYTDSVTLEIHPEHTAISKFLVSLQAALDKGVSVSVNVNMLKESWSKMESYCELVTNRYPTIKIHKKMLFSDPIQNTTPRDYNKEQQSKLKSQKLDLKLIDSSGEETFTDYQTLLLDKRNNFTDWHCFSGIEQLIVDAWGRIYRGHCRLNGPIGTIYDRIIHWPELPIVCRADYCRNAFDINATKEK